MHTGSDVINRQPVVIRLASAEILAPFDVDESGGSLGVEERNYDLFTGLGRRHGRRRWWCCLGLGSENGK